MASTTDTISAVELKTPLVLSNGTPLVIPMAGKPLPCTFWLSSAAGGRLIEFSVDNGITYHTASPDYSISTQLVLKIGSSITHLRITGTTNDTYGTL